MTEDLLKEVKAIKVLLVALLLSSGAAPDDVAAVLRVDRSRISQMVPVRRFKGAKGR